MEDLLALLGVAAGVFGSAGIGFLLGRASAAHSFLLGHKEEHFDRRALAPAHLDEIHAHENAIAKCREVGDKQAAAEYETSLALLRQRLNQTYGREKDAA